MHGLSAGQLKIMQEAITLLVFVVFARLYLGEKMAWNYYVAFALVFAAVFFRLLPGKCPMRESWLRAGDRR
jgi:uncharacterized protein (DUF486 family)